MNNIALKYDKCEFCNGEGGASTENGEIICEYCLGTGRTVIHIHKKNDISKKNLEIRFYKNDTEFDVENAKNMYHARTRINEWFNEDLQNRPGKKVQVLRGNDMLIDYTSQITKTGRLWLTNQAIRKKNNKNGR